MESPRDDQQNNSGRSHHHVSLLRSQQPLPAPKSYDYNFQAIDGHREAHLTPQPHHLNYSPHHHLYGSFVGQFASKEQFNDSLSPSLASSAGKNMSSVTHSRVSGLTGYEQNGDGLSHHHISHMSMPSSMCSSPHQAVLQSYSHVPAHPENGSDVSDLSAAHQAYGVPSSSFSLNPGLVSFMPHIEQNHNISAFCTVSNDRRYYDSSLTSMPPVSSAQHYQDYRQRESHSYHLHHQPQLHHISHHQGGSRQQGKGSASSTPCPMDSHELHHTGLSQSCSSDSSGTPLSALNQLASVDECCKQEQQRILPTDVVSQRASSQGEETCVGLAPSMGRKRNTKRAVVDDSLGSTTSTETANDRSGGKEVGDLEDSAIQSAARVVERGRYECALCAAVCVDRQGFADHLFGFHLGIARFFCRFCDKKFFYRPKVYEHIREAHSKNVAGKKKKGVVPFLYQIEPEARVTLLAFLKGRDGREGGTTVGMQCLGNRGATRRQRGGSKSSGKAKVLKHLGAKAAFPCQHCKKEFTAQSYVDRHVKKGACNRRRVGKRSTVRSEGNGVGVEVDVSQAPTPSPSPDCSPPPTPPASSPQQPVRSFQQQKSTKRTPTNQATERSGQAGPYLPYGNASHHSNAPIHQSSGHSGTRDDPESYVLLEL